MTGRVFMAGRTIKLDHLRVAAPCNESWETMCGNDKVRLCSHCNLGVRDLSQLTRPQIETLIAASQGRLCVRVRKHDDGTLVTAARAFTLPGLKRRVSLLAGATFAALTGLFTGAAVAQSSTQNKAQCPNGAQVTFKRAKLTAQDKQGTLRGVVTDPQGGRLPGAQVTLQDKHTQQSQVTTADEQGEYSFGALARGTYTLFVVAPQFQRITIKDVKLHANEAVHVDATLPIAPLPEEKVQIERKAGDADSVTIGILVFTEHPQALLLPTINAPGTHGRTGLGRP